MAVKKYCFPADKWFKDAYSEKVNTMHRRGKTLFSARTKFQDGTKLQDVKIIEFENYGKVLVLDGIIQSSAGDEAIYHELLVQPAMFLNPFPEDVLILGGGEGATSREVLKHKNVKKAVMIDIDGELVEACKSHLKEMHQGAFDDPRHELRIADAIDYVKKTDEKYDVIIGDLVDPKSELARLFYTECMFKKVSGMLKQYGVFATQSSDVTNNSLAQKDNQYLSGTYQSLKKVFKNVNFYYEYIPSFSDYWSWIICSNDISPERLGKTMDIDERAEKLGIDLKYYNSNTHQRAFSLSKNIADFLTEK